MGYGYRSVMNVAEYISKAIAKVFGKGVRGTTLFQKGFYPTTKGKKNVR